MNEITAAFDRRSENNAEMTVYSCLHGAEHTGDNAEYLPEQCMLPFRFIKQIVIRCFFCHDNVDYHRAGRELPPRNTEQCQIRLRCIKKTEVVDNKAPLKSDRVRER